MKIKKMEIKENLLNSVIANDELVVIKGGRVGEPVPGAEITLEQECPCDECK